MYGWGLIEEEYISVTHPTLPLSEYLANIAFLLKQEQF